MNVDELKVMNTKVLQVMMEDIQSRKTTTVTQSSVIQTLPQPRETRETREPTQTRVARNAFQKPPPQQIDFSEKASQRQSNLAELVEQQLAMRETEMRSFHPSPNESATSSFASYNA
jgi:hypothetical protein